MSNFLIVTAGKNEGPVGRQRFSAGIQLAADLKGQKPSAVLEGDNLWVASFPRQNGSGGTICTDPETGDWLLSLGTWLHTGGFGVGNEIKLLKCIQNEGVEHVVGNLEGFFTIVSGTSVTNEFVVLTDIVGSCHSFIRSWGNTIALSGSSLLLAAIDDAELDHTSFQEFICGGIIYQDRTLFREVKKLEPAICLRFHDGRLVTRKHYWQPGDLVPESLEDSKAVAAFKERIVDIAGRLGSMYNKPVCDLTGGYDSRVIVAGFLASKTPFSTVVSGKSSSPDSRVSASLARVKGLAHQRIDPDPISSYKQIERAVQLTDGEYDAVEYSRVQQIHTELSQRYEISINGSFGEIARGYWWEILFPHIGRARSPDSRYVARMRYVPRGFDANLIPVSQRLDFTSHLAAIFKQTNCGLESLPNTYQMDIAYIRMRMQRWQGRIASSTNQIWPCLSPLMFRSILEIMLQAKSSLRCRSLLIRKVLPELDPVMGGYPLEHGYPPLPVTITNLHRFWPVIPMFVNRLKARLGWTKSPYYGSDHDSARLHLWKDSQVREALRVDRSMSISLLNASALTSFLRCSELEQFPYSRQWAKILTVECTLQALSAARKSCRSQFKCVH